MPTTGRGRPALARRPTAEKSAARHRLLLMALVCTWAVSWPVMKIGVSAVPPLWFGCLRYLVGSTCLAIVLAAKRKLTLPPRQDWPFIVVSGTLQMAAFSALTGLALTIIPPGRASVLAYSTPIWVVPLAAWRLNETISRTALLGIALGLLGSLMIARPSIEPGRGPQLLGYAMLMLAAACWAISIVYVRAHAFLATPLELAPWQMLVATLLLLPTALLLEGPLRPIGSEGATALAYVGPFATAFAYWAMVEAGRHITASAMSMALLAVPCVGIAVSAATLGESISSGLLGGVLLIGLGIGLATNPISPRRKWHSRP